MFVPRLKHTEEIKEEFPREFQIEIIDRISQVSDKELDKAIVQIVSNNILIYLACSIRPITAIPKFSLPTSHELSIIFFDLLL